MSVSIINYGLANLRSVQNAFARAGVEANIITTPREIDAADRIVLPGVGAVSDAIANIRRQELEAPILAHVRRGRPFLGICLGLQMLMETCYEGGVHRGLGVVAGDCVKLDPGTGSALKIPHMGWNQIRIVRPCPLLANLPGENVYFVHGYHVRPTDTNWVAATTDYGQQIVSAIWHDNVVAVQFHPEKSQRTGARMIENFCTM